MIDAAFWASLRREEGFTPQISLAFVPPDALVSPLRLEKPLPLAPQSLTRVSPAVERPGIHLGVWSNGSGLHVWGATRTLPPFSFVLEVVTPGLLVIKHNRGDSGKFVNVAVLEGDRIKVIAEHSAAMERRGSVLVEMAVSMRAHGHGGLLLVVPAGTNEWRESMLQPITYAVAPPFAALAEAAHSEHKSLARAVDAVAGVTAVDGATVITDQYELLAFGCKIVRRPGCELVQRLLVTEPFEGAQTCIAEASRFGGTRHLAAAQFAHDQRNATAMVASQDGRFTVFSWLAHEQMVQADCIEALLL
jgi:hypothetical protein